MTKRRDEHPGRSSSAGDATSRGSVVSAPAAGIRVIFRRFWPGTRPYRGRLLMSLLLVAVGPFLDTVQIWMFKLLIDDVLIPRNFHTFPTIAGAYLGIGVAQGLGSFSDELLSTWLGERFVLDLRTRLFDHLHRLSVDFFDRRQLGDTLSRLTGDIDAIEALVLSGVTRTLAYGCEIVLFTGALFYLNWRLALASMVAAPAFLLLARYFSARIKDASREQRRRSGSVTAVAEESLGNVALVQAFDRHAAETERFHRENLGRFTAEMAATRLRALFRPLIELLEIIGVVLVMGVGVWALRHGQITLGGLLVFVTYLTRLYSPIRGAGRLSNTVYAASASAERIIDLLDQQPDVREPAYPRGLPRSMPGHQLAPGYVVIEHVRRGEDLDSYEAWSSQRYCRCFIKTLRPDHATDGSARRHLQREARLLLSLTHPHLVRAYDYLTPEGGQPPLLVLENLTGATLGYLLDGGRHRLSAPDLGHLGQHLCSALRYLHHRGHLHLDVKPSNIIASHGLARLIDLSLARPPAAALQGPAHPATCHLSSSPAVTSAHPRTSGASAWCYQAATGTQPFDIPGRSASASANTSTMSLCQTQLARPAPKVRARRRLPTTVAHIIDACLHPNPHQRPTLGACGTPIDKKLSMPQRLR